MFLTAACWLMKTYLLPLQIRDISYKISVLLTYSNNQLFTRIAVIVRQKLMDTISASVIAKNIIESATIVAKQFVAKCLESANINFR